MQDVTRSTLEEVVEVFEGFFTETEVKSIVYAAYSYSTLIGDENINNVHALLAYIDWEYFVKTKERTGTIPVTIIE